MCSCVPCIVSFSPVEVTVLSLYWAPVMRFSPKLFYIKLQLNKITKTKQLCFSCSMLHQGQSESTSDILDKVKCFCDFVQLR